jgi:pyruvate kinase
VEAVACMHRIAVEAETRPRPAGSSFHNGDEIDDSTTLAACGLAREVGAAAIVTPTLSGRTAKLVARHRPSARVVAVAPSDAVLRSLTLVWGIAGVRMSPGSQGADRLTAAVEDAARAGAIREGDRVVVLAGHPVEGGPRFPTVRVVRVGAGGTSQEP